jgi:hypothetical protein
MAPHKVLRPRTSVLKSKAEKRCIRSAISNPNQNLLERKKAGPDDPAFILPRLAAFMLSGAADKPMEYRTICEHLLRRAYSLRMAARTFERTSAGISFMLCVLAACSAAFFKSSSSESARATKSQSMPTSLHRSTFPISHLLS